MQPEDNEETIAFLPEISAPVINEEDNIASRAGDVEEEAKAESLPAGQKQTNSMGEQLDSTGDNITSSSLSNDNKEAEINTRASTIISEDTAMYFPLKSFLPKTKPTKKKTLCIKWKTAVVPTPKQHPHEQHTLPVRTWSKTPLAEDTMCSLNDDVDMMFEFYSHAHHNQDEAFVSRAVQEQATRKAQLLSDLNDSIAKSKAHINTLLNQKWVGETQEFQKRAKDKHSAMVKKQKLQRAQLTETQEKRLESFQKKMEERKAHLMASNSQHDNEQMRKWHQFEQEERQKMHQRCREQLQMLKTHHAMRQEELLLEFTEEKVRIKTSRHQQVQYHHNLFKQRAEERKKEILKNLQTNSYYIHDLDNKTCGEDQQDRYDHLEHLINEYELRSSKIAEDVLEEENAQASPSKSTTAKTSVGTTEVAGKIQKASETTDAAVSSLVASNATSDSATTGASLIDHATASAKNTNRKQKEESRPPSPSGLMNGGKGVSPNYTRQKLRKSLSSGIPIQLAIDIHNEGIVAHYRSVADNDTCGSPTPVAQEHGVKEGETSNTATTSSNKHPSAEMKKGVDTITECGGKWSSGPGKSKFFAWGIQAREFLYSVFCGEVPMGYLADEIDSTAKDALQGGQIKCMVTDMRTSERAAAAQRAAAAEGAHKRKNLPKREDLETDLYEIKAEFLQAEEKLCIANEINEKARREYQKIHLKTSHCWKPDGQLARNQIVPEDRPNIEKFITAKKRYATAVYELRESKARVKDLKLKKEEIERQLRMQEVRDNKEEEESPGRIADALSTIRETMEQRRIQLESKRSDEDSRLFFHSQPADVAKALEASLRQKMEHRRLVIVLRPNIQIMLDEVKKALLEKIRSVDHDKKIDEKGALIRAEQLLLLAIHPAAPNESLPTVPPAPWAEPGWQLELNVDPPKSTASFLPSMHVPSAFRRNLAECTSCSGRQSAALLPTHFFRMLNAPLTKLGKASAPAEPQDIKNISLAQLQFDPFQTNEEDIDAGYRFTPPVLKKVPATTGLGNKRSASKIGEPEKAKKSRGGSAPKPTKEELCMHVPSKASSLTADGSAAVDRQSRGHTISRSLQQSSSPPSSIIDPRRPSIMTDDTLEKHMNHPPLQQQPQQPRLAQPVYDQNRGFVMDSMMHQQHQQHYQAELLRAMSNQPQQALPSSSRAVQAVPPMNPQMGQNSQHIPQYFHHPHSTQVQQQQQQQQTAVASAQQARQQQLLQQQMQRVMQQAPPQQQLGPPQQLGQPYPFSTYNQAPPPFPHAATAGQMVLPPQPVNVGYGMQHSPQQPPSPAQQRPRNSNEDYDPLFMLFNK